MGPKRRPTDDDAVEAVRLLLNAVAGGAEISEMARAVVRLHPDNDTFPGEVFLRVAADALDEAGVNINNPLPYEDVRGRFLADCEFRGRENQKIRFALLAVASVHGGVEPDLLDEVVWWGTDDFWRYALIAATAYLRASAERAGTPLIELCALLARRYGVTVDDPPVT